MAVNLIPSIFHGWKGFLLENGDVSLRVVPDLGGRIISLEIDGEEILFVQGERAGEIPDLRPDDDFRSDKRRIGFGLWGGDKTWLAPQSEWIDAIPPIDLDAGKYTTEIDGAAITMTSGVCRETRLRIIRRVELKYGGEILIDQTIVNEGDKTIKRGIWDVTQVKRPFDVFIPCAKSSLRPYPDEGDSVRLFNHVVVEAAGWSRIACRRPAHFKIGGVSPKGQVVAMNTFDDKMIKFTRDFAVDTNAEYAHDANVEVYNSKDYDYLEIESHGPIVELAPGERTSHSMEWRVTKRIISPSELESIITTT